MAGMEKTVEMGGIEYKLIANAQNTIVYETQFGRDLFPDMIRFTDIFDDKDGKKVFNPLKVKSAIGQRIFWTMARCADKDFPSFDKWVEGLEAFRIMEVLFDLTNLIAFNLKQETDVKAKNIEAVVNED